MDMLDVIRNTKETKNNPDAPTFITYSGIHVVARIIPVARIISHSYIAKVRAGRFSTA